MGQKREETVILVSMHGNYAPDMIIGYPCLYGIYAPDVVMHNERERRDGWREKRTYVK